MSFLGDNMSMLKYARRCGAAVILSSLPAAAMAAPLKVVNVGAPAINCVFSVKCTIVVNDTVGNIIVPGISGTARLQSRDFTGEAPAPGAGKHGYLYRVDLTQAVGVVNAPCVTALKLDFGPVTKLPYVKAGSVEDVYVITQGGIGSVGVAKADRVGNVTTFTFGKPICAGASAVKGETSYFFGMTGPKPPQATAAQLQVTGGSWVTVAARVPAH
jgi:hypothetical protein